MVLFFTFFTLCFGIRPTGNQMNLISTSACKICYTKEENQVIETLVEKYNNVNFLYRFPQLTLVCKTVCFRERKDVIFKHLSDISDLTMK